MPPSSAASSNTCTAASDYNLGKMMKGSEREFVPQRHLAVVNERRRKEVMEQLRQELEA